MISGGIGSAGQLQQGLNSIKAAPRPLGFVDRAAGLATGLEQLEHQLASLMSRIDGVGETSQSKGHVTPSGLGSQLSGAEDRLRSCTSLVDELHNRF